MKRALVFASFGLVVSCGSSDAGDDAARPEVGGEDTNASSGETSTEASTEDSRPLGADTTSNADVAPIGDTSTDTSTDAIGVDVVRPDDPCKTDGGCPVGVWIDVTPSKIDLKAGACGNYGTKTVQVDPARPQDVYTTFHCQGIWKSTDYGQTWTGPLNTGENAAKVTDCAGSITLARTSSSGPPTIHLSCIRGSGTGYWVSTNGGVDFTPHVAPASAGTDQQWYPPVLDPSDGRHLLMAGHGNDNLVETADGGVTWKALVAPKPQKSGTSGMAFLEMGDPAKTRRTWLWLAAQSGGTIGTYRTEDGGSTYAPVDKNEHVNGATSVWQPGGGIVFMAGSYSALGDGVLRSIDYGKTWAHVGANMPETVVIGTSKSLHAMYGWAIGASGAVDPLWEHADEPGTGAWSKSAVPTSWTQGPAQAATTNDGKNDIILMASYNSGMWRYVEK